MIGRTGKDAPAARFLGQGFMIPRRVETEHAQLETVLPFRLAVTAPAIAAQLRENRHDLGFKMDRRRGHDTGYFDRHARLILAMPNDDGGPAFGSWPHQTV